MGIKVKDYETFVVENAKQPITDETYNFIGLAGETGECMEWLKKSVYRKDPKFTNEMLLLELGDVLHYVTRIALNKGWTIKDLLTANVQKLQRRKSA